MRIGIIIGRIGGVDGVALETEKWQEVLTRMGHEVFVLAGEFEGRKARPETEDLFMPLSFYGPECTFEQKRAFFDADASVTELLEALERHATAIAEAIEAWAGRRRLDLLLPENSGTLPYHLSMGMGIKRAAESLGLPVLAHHHDFAWERPGRYDSPFPEINTLVAETFPLRGSHVRHAVINSAAKRELEARFSAPAVVVPNVMDFERPFAVADAYNGQVRADLGLSSDDLLLFQVTRIVRRKSIETAVELVHQLQDSRVKLIITGSPNDDPDRTYVSVLRRLIAACGLQQRVLFAHQHFANARDVRAGNRVYSLEDAYVTADACTFFSTYEGFGNAFVEAVLARRPIFVNNYQPVYEDDIAPLGFETVQLEDATLTDEAVEAIAKVLHSPGLARDMAQVNFELGREHFSFQTLQARLTKLLDGLPKT